MDNSHDAKRETLDASRAERRSAFLSPFLKFLALVGIVLLGIALLLPSVRSAREPARRNICLNNLKQIGIALSNYEAAHGSYPPAYTVDANGRPLHSWRTLILPHMEQKPLYDRIDLTKPWDDPANSLAYNTIPDVYCCPSDPTDNAEKRRFTNYLAVVTPDSAIRTEDSLGYRALPSPAQTLLVIDAGPKHATHWMSPIDADEEVVLGLDAKSRLPHNGNMFLGLFADGHGSALTLDSTPTVRRAQITASADDNRELSGDD